MISTGQRNTSYALKMPASAEIEFKDISIDVPWGYIAGRWYGNRKVRPILALHGWMDNMGTWEKLIKLLPKHVGVLCIDFPGHGHSSKFPPGITYNDFDFVHVIIRVMKEYNWQKVSLLGHSMGSSACFQFTCIYPQKVDMLIAIDFIYANSLPSKERLKVIRQNVENNILLDERHINFPAEEPPLYTYAELELLLYKGTMHSLDLENCKYILDRNIKRSTKYPEKYYFTRDGKLKYYNKNNEKPEFFEEMAKNIKNVPYLIVGCLRSPFTTLEEYKEFFETIRKNNPHFEFHQIDGTHHAHLNNADKVAAVVAPFINRHRPVALDHWTLTEDGENVNQLVNLKKKKNAKENKREYRKSKL